MNDRNETTTEGHSCGCGGGQPWGGTGKWIWIALAVAVVGVLIARNAQRKTAPESQVAPNAPSMAVQAPDGPAEPPSPPDQERPLPRLVDLGAGKELFRHEGFFGKDDILAKWKELGDVVGQSSGGGTN